MRYAFKTDERLYQLDLVHAASITGYKLWEDRIMSLEDRKTIVGKLQTALYTLKNSVEKHLEDKNTEDLKKITLIAWWFLPDLRWRVEGCRGIQISSSD